ncbi:MAG: ribonuclease G [Aquincola tertiaricarbonis]|uniref:ribonuclease G n=1 Tax=Aquincola TaxID=391952 RepID=UPI000614A209|nr:MULTISPECIES: ribonuclease G [Aquincola]MCR5865359.1 ribonuclease G [Aquincola sp. J276]
MQDILINWTPQETRVAIVENGAVQELHIERALERGLVGNIYLGKVVRVLPGMQSAFIDIGLDRAAFLHVADLHTSPPRSDHGGMQTPVPIERQVFEGQTLTVQVIKDSIGSKGARLSTQISIAGRLLVYLPQDNHIGISQKIGSHELREQLRQRMAVLVGKPEEGGGGGFILRTNAEDATDPELADDIAYLRKTWASIRERSHARPPGTLLHQDLTLAERVLRDLITDTTHTVRIDSRLQYEHLAGFGATYTPTSVRRLELYRGERPIFDLFNIDDEIARALARRVDLKSGGYLIIDQTEALTTVDVNTGGYVGARNFDDTIFKTNLEAAGAIARQLRLRNLGGIVIVDFIDMAREEHQAAVLAEFRKQLARDRTKTTVSGFTQLGLVEMTRKRTRESLAHMLCEPCPTCAGRGQVKTPRSVCYDILREILREARQFDPKEFRVVASAAVVEMLLDEESQHLAGLSDFIGKPISLSAEPTSNPEQYDIVLL